MNGRAGPLSPSSNEGSEWSGYSRYGPPSSQPPYSPSLPHNRGNLVTPPVSGSSNGAPPRMSNGMSRRPGEPSPPNSIARSSYGTNFSSSENQRRQAMRMEEKLSQHHAILKRYLAQSLRDEKLSSKPNRARDKLLRLSAIQFQELSTDVYDELLRRQSASGQQTNGPGQVPAYLLPKENFHPKRNQARQKLATLPSSRFRDLATDVFYELERRFPQFAGDIPRNGSPAMYGPPSRTGTPTGMRPGHHQGPPPRNASLGGQSIAGLGLPGAGQDDEYGRPMAKTFQSNTIIPNKGTMVEDDDDDGMSDVYGGRRDTTYTARSLGGSEKDKKAIVELETQVNELQDKVKDMVDQLRDKDVEFNRLHETHDHRETTTNLEKQRWETLRSDLESQLRDAQNLNHHLRSELDRVQDEKERSENELRSQLDVISSRASGDDEWKNRYEGLDRAHQDLRTELIRQEKTTSEVRNEAMGFLNQLKDLSKRTDQNSHREEELIRKTHQLENEVKEWKNRYAKAKTQSRNARSDSLTIQPSDVRHLGREGSFSSRDGLVKDIDVTKFQMAVDELLRCARSGEPNTVLAQVKAVVVSVRAISLAIGSDNSSVPNENSEQLSKLRVKVSATTNNLITASKNFALSSGLTPVSLLDAAASHLSASIVELLRIVKMRPSAEPDFDREDDENSIIADSPADYYGIISSPQRGPATSGGQGEKRAMTNGLSNGVTRLPTLTQASYKAPDNAKVEELKNFLDTRTNALLTGIQTLVSSIRTSAPPPDILDTIVSITSTTSQIINQTYSCVPTSSPAHSISQRLADDVEKMEQKGREGEAVENEQDWNAYVKALPPLAFEIARGVKELGAWVDGETGANDFS